MIIVKIMNTYQEVKNTTKHNNQTYDFHYSEGNWPLTYKVAADIARILTLSSSETSVASKGLGGALASCCELDKAQEASLITLPLDWS